MAKKNLLIIHQGALGDVVAIFAAISRLNEYFARIDVVCQSQLGKLAAELGLVKKCYPLESAYFSSLFSGRPHRRVKELLRPYGNVVLFSFSEELEQSVNRITQNRCVRFAPKPAASNPIHITTYAIENLIQCGLLNEEDQNCADFSSALHLKEKMNFPANRNKILLHPGSGSIRKRWPLSQFKHVEKQLNANGLQTEFVVGPAEMDLLNEFENRDRKIHVPGDLIALAMLYKTAGGYIGNDSGTSHLAAFMGLPTVVIFGPADPQRWKPNGPYVEVVRPELECLPCFETDQTNCPEPKCLQDITPDTVLKTFYKVYMT